MSDETTTESTESTTPDAQAGVTVSVEMMLYEAGMIANALSSKTLGSALAQRLFEEEQKAEAASESRFSFAFSPFEAGMALDGMSRSVDGSLDQVKDRLGDALAAKMEELGIGAIGGDNGGGLGGTESGGDQGGLGDGSSNTQDPSANAPSDQAPSDSSASEQGSNDGESNT